MTTYECKLCAHDVDELEAISFRTTGNAYVICEPCKNMLVTRMKKQHTPYIWTPYVSYNALKSY